MFGSGAGGQRDDLQLLIGGKSSWADRSEEHLEDQGETVLSVTGSPMSHGVTGMQAISLATRKIGRLVEAAAIRKINRQRKTNACGVELAACQSL